MLVRTAASDGGRDDPEGERGGVDGVGPPGNVHGMISERQRRARLTPEQHPVQTLRADLCVHVSLKIPVEE
jgi:hypothetical protein